MTRYVIKGAMVRNVVLCSCFFLVMAGIVVSFPRVGQAEPPEVSISAEGAALIDVHSGRILWSHNGDQPMLIASITKIMTAIVAIEEGDLSSPVKVSRRAFGVEGSSLYLKMGESMSLHHLLYGMMLRSGNDAATAIAEHIGGSVEGFVHLMNTKAEEIGMTNSFFVNPHGLNETDEHMATANDMAKLTAYALKNPVFQEIVKTQLKKAPNPNEDWNYSWFNKNKMLSLYEGADGVKTGYTRKAGRSLVSSATREGRQLAVVTINAPNDWVDHTRLLNYGFEHFPLRKLMDEGKTVTIRKGDESYRLSAASTFYYPLTDEELKSVDTEARVFDDHSLNARFGQGGSISYYLNRNEIGKVALTLDVATGAKETTSYLSSFRMAVRKVFTW